LRIRTTTFEEMSSPDKAEALAAHPPAVKVGGMRIVQDKSHLKHKSKDTAVPEPHEELNAGSSPPKSSEVTISGAPNRGNADFPEQAVQAFHDKPVPKNQLGAQPAQHPIQQPRRFN
jgi:hypothetical protein